MNKAIIVDYDPFSMESRVFVLKDNDKEHVRIFSNLEDLTSGLIGLAEENEIYTIKVNGPLAIESELRREINTKYSQNKITVEGI